MRAMTAAVLTVLLGASIAHADLYQWKDKEGVIHITDDVKKVPEGYRGDVKVFKSTPAEKGREGETAQPPAPAQPPSQPQSQKVELYGDHTLEWWDQIFRRKRDEVRLLESTVNTKRQFINMFEGGRRFGQTFGQGEVDTYNRYKKDISEDEKRLQALRDETDDLKRKATIAGVPREIRE